MGPRLKLPPYVHGFIDRNGKPRFYFRRRSYKSLPLPGLPWSPTFMAAYETAMQGDPTSLVPLMLWLQLLLILLVAASWAAVRWGGVQVWLVGAPLVFSP